MHLSRLRIRRVGATASAVMAAIYYLIGLGVLDVGHSTTSTSADLTGFGALAGTAFLLLALLLATTDRRWIWIAATVFQFFVYVVYVSVSSGRVPAFEVWGVTLRVVQIPLVLALLYLSIKAPRSEIRRAAGAA
jgi:hypothetical protein